MDFLFFEWQNSSGLCIRVEFSTDLFSRVPQFTLSTHVFAMSVCVCLLRALVCSTAAAQAAIDRGIARSEAKYALRLERRAAEEALAAEAGGGGADGDDEDGDEDGGDEDEDGMVDDEQDEDEKREQDAMLADEADAAADAASSASAAADSTAALTASSSSSSSSSSAAAAAGEVLPGRVLSAHEELMRDRYLRDTESVRVSAVCCCCFLSCKLYFFRLAFRSSSFSILDVECLILELSCLCVEFVRA